MIDALFDQIRNLPSTEHGAGAPLQHIRQAEKTLSNRFSESYRRFLSTLGWVDGPTLMLAGLGHDTPAHLDLIRTVQSERTLFEPQIPAHLLPIMNDGAGNNYCLDCRSFVNGECQVVFWNHELLVDQTPETVSPSFVQWLHLILDEPQ
ncbi:MAG: SMI1/KNR4 family protein [Phycisphaerales bacterium]|nr:SMI1/KNR4 family protein [Phycisphaerales bacterium]